MQGVWSNVNLITGWSSKGTAYQPVQSQVDNDDFTNAFMDAIATPVTLVQAKLTWMNKNPEQKVCHSQLMYEHNV